MTSLIAGIDRMAYSFNSILGSIQNIPGLGGKEDIPPEITKEGGVLEVVGRLMTMICGIASAVAFVIALGILSYAGIKVMINHGKKDQIWVELGQTGKAVVLGLIITCAATLLLTALGAILSAVGVAPSV